MKPIIQNLFAGMLVALSVGAAAQQSQPPGAVALGAVEAVYVKVAPGLFIETRLLRVKQPAETWSDVRMHPDGSGKPRSELAKNPEGVTVRKGDVVRVDVAARDDFRTGPLPENTQLTKIIAPAGSRLTRQFGQPDDTASPIALVGHQQR